MNLYTPAKERTMYFIGVTTGKSSIMKVFPKWADQLRTTIRDENIEVKKWLKATEKTTVKTKISRVPV